MSRCLMDDYWDLGPESGFQILRKFHSNGPTFDEVIHLTPYTLHATPDNPAGPCPAGQNSFDHQMILNLFSF